MKSKIIILITLFLGFGLICSAGHDDHMRQFRFKQQLDEAIFDAKDALALADPARTSEFCIMVLDKMLSNQKLNRSDYIDEVLYKYWETNAWINENLEQSLFYDDINTEGYTYVWENNQWNYEFHNIITYDGQGRPVSTLVQLWEPDGSEWIDFMLSTVTWNANNYPDEIIMQFNFGGGWMNFMRIAYSYNAQQLGTEVLMQEWDMIGSTWVNYARDLFTYNASGQMIEELSQDWIGNTWVDDEKGILTYDPNGNVAEKIKYLWMNNSWVNYLFFTYTYDASWNLIEEKEEIWDNGAWQNSWLYNYSYDAEGRLSEVLERYWEAKGWTNDALSLFTYGLPMSSETRYAKFDVTVFPNPASEYITIMLGPEIHTEITVRISDMSGRLVKSYPLQKLTTGLESIHLQLPDLASGGYLLQIISDQKASKPVKLFIRN